MNESFSKDLQWSQLAWWNDVIWRRLVYYIDMFYCKYVFGVFLI